MSKGRFAVWRGQSVSVGLQKHDGGGKGRSLVALFEGVILGDSGKQLNGEDNNVILAVCPMVLGFR
jgi:hypothetical protein